MEGVFHAAAEQSKQLRVLVLFDAQLTPDGQIHQRRRDVAHVGAVVEQRAGFRGRHLRWRLVLDRDRPATRVAAAPPPAVEREQENGDRDEERPVAAHGRQRAIGHRRRRNHTLVPSYNGRQTFVVAEGVWHREADDVAVYLDAGILRGATIDAVERGRPCTG